MKDAEVLLSFVVPIRGDAKELAQLEVVGSRVFPAVEWVLVVDGEPGDAVSIALAIVGDRSDVTIVQQRRRGPGVARNTGLGRASGRVVAFVDSDDVADVSAFAALAAEMTEQSARIGVLGYAIVASDTPTEVVERYVPRAGWQDPWPLLRSRAAVWRFAFDRHFLLRSGFGFPDQAYAEDLVFLVLALASGEQAWGLPACSYLYRLHSDTPLTQRQAVPLDVASTLRVLADAKSTSHSRVQSRVIDSWRSRIWLRNRRSAMCERTLRPGGTNLLRGLVWSIAWAINSPRRIGALSRMRMGRVDWRTR